MGKKASSKHAKSPKILEEEEEEDREPELSPVDSGDEEESSSAYDSSDDDHGGLPLDGAEEEEEEDVVDSDEESSSGGSESFEEQGSSDEDEERLRGQEGEDESDDDEIAVSYEQEARSWNGIASAMNQKKRSANGSSSRHQTRGSDGIGGSAGDDPTSAAMMHTDDWSSDEDDEEGKQNRIGRVPLHWYDDFDHVGYDAHGEKVIKSASSSGDRIDEALAREDNAAAGKFVVRDALNDRDVELTRRQLELIRRVQGGAFVHPEHDANPDYVDYFSGVNPVVSGLSSNRTEPKSRFQPSRWEQMQVERLIERLNRGAITMEYLTGRVRDMNDVNRKDPKKPFLLWTGDEEDELNARKGPQHIAAPKLPPPSHAESYIPPDEYLPTEDELKKWEDMEPKDRPHGHLVPKKFLNLRSVGAYRHSVREAFERCLDLYLCPRVLKRRLNIDPESLVPRLPRASDLRPFPTTKCIEYKTLRTDDKIPVIRCVAASPDGQFLVSGASDGYLRMWEVQSGRLLRSWDLSRTVSGLNSEQPEAANNSPVAPVVAVDWNPNRSHHCLLAAVGSCVVVVATGTAGQNDAEITEALLASALAGGSDANNARAKRVVKWVRLPGHASEHDVVSSLDRTAGPVCALRTAAEVSSVRWQAKGDYFLSVSPKAGAAAVLIHQLSRSHSQQPFGKAKGEAQVACFHPNKPFLFVASQQHVRIYHLVKQNMVKRLVTGCRWISSLDVHPSGDHLIVGTLDRRVVWFDLDLSATPYKTLKYHDRAVRSCRFHGRYPLLASCSDDGSVHIFHSTVYSDLMRNPLVVPVKVLRGHSVTNKLGVLTVFFHPSQPWIFTGGADGRIFLFQDI